ncbi:hypothetical protein AVEN_7695-1 [Araneus ventricosus]|uniref:Uncharacterized protein n=1 Tax=Araneus ventricosus TaxID=182803 RepID=A0A4Y2UP28_ARAVE|nr:hypothetical protein AVEN_7695-1 [Araneus ventricosus]
MTGAIKFPFSPFGHKSEIQSFETGDKSPVCVSIREGKCASESDWRNQGGEGRVLFPKSENPPYGGEGVWEDRSGFGASVIDPPKSIYLNGWKTKLVEME